MLTYSAVRLTDQTYVTMANKKSMNLKHINIVDPTFSKNNLGKSISELNASRIKQGVKLQMKNVSKIYHQARIAQMSQQQNGSEVLLKGLLNMFQVTFECIGAHPIMSLLLP
jgi:phosphotransacetylase